MLIDYKAKREDEYQITAEVVKHSSYLHEELITVEIQLHRFILPEYNTHRKLSRNFQSSRAVTVKALMDQVKMHPAMPVHWGKNQSGMVAKEELSPMDQAKAEKIWLSAAREAVKHAEMLSAINVHKQVVNRLLEPFMWTKGVSTATKEGWLSLLDLRLHPDAQPEIQALAMCIAAAIEESFADKLEEGDYHLPYVSKELLGQIGIEQAVKISSSCAAQVSYRKSDDSIEKAIRVYDMLNLPVDGVYPEDPPHYSPTEHVAKVESRYNNMSGNFHSVVFQQYRKFLELGIEGEFYGRKK
jgi:thymidylate synthase ThyX